jgi:hypothetical protein
MTRGIEHRRRTSFRFRISALVSALSRLAICMRQCDAQQCDYFNDYCPYLAEGVCDTENDVCPPNTDCLDCSPCQTYNFLGCEPCTAAGCTWCPTDALCLDQPLGSDYWAALLQGNYFTKQLSCLQEEDWVSQCDGATSRQVYSDPLYSAQQWAYQLLNVEPVWQQGILGQGVMIRVNDPDGFDISHPELVDRFNATASCNNSQWTFDPEKVHGTAVASLALGSGNNGHCAVGIAPEASLSACVGPTEISDKNVAALLLHGLMLVRGYPKQM